ncbi:MAG: acyl-CoA synthetase (AMP-forming)/AMP-acid ligase II [Paracoccaceae bacterium]|jgi:acyl-CoA synthetase (AMP-forming)/AMP-acid ligase II
MGMTPTLPPDGPTLKTYYESGAWGSQTIYDIVRAHSAARPDAAAVTSSFRTWSWAELVDLIDAFAADLADRGLVQGDTIFVGAPNRIETIIALLAASRDGFVCCPSPHRNHTVAEIAAMCERAACAAYIHCPGHGSDAGGDEILGLIGALPSLRHIYVLPGDGMAAPFEGALKIAPDDAVPPTGNPDLVTYLAFTSGSTGAPKGVMHSDNSQLVAARGIAGAWDLDADTVTLSLSPFSHNLGCGTLWTSLVVGGEFVLHDWSRGESLLDHIETACVDYLVGVPTHAMDLLAELKTRGAKKYDRLKSFRVSAAACPEHVAAALYDYGIPVQKGYGMTETNGHQYGQPGDSRDLVIGTSGVCCPGYELRIFDANDPDRAAEPGMSGLVGGKGASLMLGYFNDRKASEDCINASGWFLTGDLGMIDENGYLRLTGRAKELIVRGGHNINPNLLEDLALRHPAIDLVAAIPVADDRLGERACLAVMFEDGQAVPASEILTHLADEGLSRYDMPEFWLPLADIPLMPNGKMEKLEIIRRVRDGSLVPVPVAAG